HNLYAPGADDDRTDPLSGNLDARNRPAPPREGRGRMTPPTRRTHMSAESPARPGPSTPSTRTRPFTGAEYLESLRDGREIWIYGARVKDVTTHPAFRNTARMIARLYDALHDPARKDILTTETDTGSGGYTHRFYKGPRNAGD